MISGTSAQCRLMLSFKIKDYQEMSNLCKNFKIVPSEEKLQNLKFPLLSFKIPHPNKIETKYIKSKNKKTIFTISVLFFVTFFRVRVCNY